MTGIFINDASPTVTNCIIEESRSEADGTAVLINGLSEAVVDSCVIRNNDGSDGASAVRVSTSFGDRDHQELPDPRQHQQQLRRRHPRLPMLRPDRGQRDPREHQQLGPGRRNRTRRRLRDRPAQHREKQPRDRQRVHRKLRRRWRHLQRLLQQRPHRGQPRGRQRRPDGAGIYVRTGGNWSTTWSGTPPGTRGEAAAFIEAPTPRSRSPTHLWENRANSANDQIHLTDSGLADVTYCDVQGGLFGVGNINADPDFVSPKTETTDWPPFPASTPATTSLRRSRGRPRRNSGSRGRDRHGPARIRTPPAMPADINGDGVVNGADPAQVLSAFGEKGRIFRRTSATIRERCGSRDRPGRLGRRL